MKYLLENNIDGLFLDNMVYTEVDKEGKRNIIELIEGGKDIPVDESNK